MHFVNPILKFCMLIDTLLLDTVYSLTLCLYTAAKFIVEQYTLEAFSSIIISVLQNGNRCQPSVVQAYNEKIHNELRGP